MSKSKLILPTGKFWEIRIRTLPKGTAVDFRRVEQDHVSRRSDFMPVTAEEEVVLLYTLNACGGHPSKGRATDFIISNGLLKSRESDADIVETRETRLENRIAWTRQNLKDKLQLTMPKSGVWAITPKGVERLQRVALKSLNWQKPGNELDAVLDDFRFARFSEEFLKRLKALGLKLKQSAST